MTEKNDRDLSVEVGRRLDNLFGDADASGEKAPDADSPQDAGTNYYPLRVVKANILSIDWEITDETIAGLLKQLDLLRKTYRDDKVVQILIQMMISLGKYIKVRKGQANVHSMKVLKSVFAGLEKVAGGGVEDPDRKMEILREKMREFHALQARVAAESGKARSAPDREAAVSALSAEELRQIARYLADDLRRVIREELRLLGEELRRR